MIVRRLKTEPSQDDVIGALEDMAMEFHGSNFGNIAKHALKLIEATPPEVVEASDKSKAKDYIDKALIALEDALGELDKR